MPRDALPTTFQSRFAAGHAIAAGAATLAFTVACFAHEVAGHAGACLAGGGAVAHVTSALFACRPGLLLADLGGPFANLLLAAASLSLLRARRPGTATHLVLLLVAAFDVFWLAGCLIEGAALVRGDFAYAVRLSGAAQLPVRAGFGIVGVGVALAMCRLLGRQGVAPGTLRLAYWVAGTVACASALFATGPIGPALRETGLESFGAMAWLWVVRERPDGPDGGIREDAREASWPMLVPALIAAGMLLALGHGYTAPVSRAPIARHPASPF
jgi:hypothetical protein